LKTCNNLRGENDLLKKNLSDILSKQNGEVEEPSQLNQKDKNAFKEIDHVVAIKASHYYKQEVFFCENFGY